MIDFSSTGARLCPDPPEILGERWKDKSTGWGVLRVDRKAEPGKARIEALYYDRYDCIEWTTQEKRIKLFKSRDDAEKALEGKAQDPGWLYVIQELPIFSKG